VAAGALPQVPGCRDGREHRARGARTPARARRKEGGGGEAGVARERVRDYPVDSLTGEWPAMTRSDGTYCVLAGSDGSKVSG